MMVPLLLACALLAHAPSPPPSAVAGTRLAGPVAVDLEGLARLIESRQCSVADYTAFTEAMQEEGGLARLGMTKVPQDNPFFEEYRLKTPIQVFHRKTSRICFGSAGVMAILEGVKAENLAKELDLALFLQTPAQILYARALRDQLLEPDGTGLKLREIIRLTVSTVSSLPGCALAGCEYRIEVQ